MKLKVGDLIWYATKSRGGYHLVVAHQRYCGYYECDIATLFSLDTFNTQDIEYDNDIENHLRYFLGVLYRDGKEVVT